VDPAAGRAYVGTSRKAALWVYDAASGRASRIEGLDPLLKDETYVWSVAVAPDGRVFAGTYPGGLLVEHDPRTGRSRSLGAPAPGRKYLRNLVVGPSGRVYCGLGTPATVVAVDPGTGAVRRLFEGEAPFAGELRLAGGQLCDGAGHCFDVAEPDGAKVSRREKVELDEHGRFQVETVGARYTGKIDLAARQNGMMTMGLGTGPDGKVYGGTYYNSSLFVVDPATGRISALGRVRDAPGEFRIFQELGAKGLLLPGYQGPLFLYQVDKPWSEDPAAPNPRKLGEIGQGQHLATSSDRRGDLVAIGTPPSYGRRGGGVTIFEVSTLRWRTYTGIVPDQSVRSLCFGPRDRLYVGTSTEAGPGEDAGTGAAHLVVLDPATGRVERDVVPAPRATSLNGVAPLDGRRVLGGVETGELFVMDGASGEVRTLATLPQIRDLKAWKADGSIVGIGWRKGLFRVDPESLAVEWIPGSPTQLLPGIAEDASGRLYVHDGTRVYRVTPRSP
jgi:outer membrane protein assembly factor BamB